MIEALGCSVFLRTTPWLTFYVYPCLTCMHTLPRASHASRLCGRGWCGRCQMVRIHLGYSCMIQLHCLHLPVRRPLRPSLGRTGFLSVPVYSHERKLRNSSCSTCGPSGAEVACNCEAHAHGHVPSPMYSQLWLGAPAVL